MFCRPWPTISMWGGTSSLRDAPGLLSLFPLIAFCSLLLQSCHASSGVSPDRGDVIPQSSLGELFQSTAPLKCGEWQEDYAQLHRQMMAPGPQMFQNPDARFVIYECSNSKRLHSKGCGGLGDMLRGVITAFTFALLSRRAFLIKAPVLMHAFYSPHIDWRFNWDVKGDVPYLAHVHQRLPVYNISGMGESSNTVATMQMMWMHKLRHQLAFFREMLNSSHNVFMVQGRRGILTSLLEDDPQLAFNPDIGRYEVKGGDEQKLRFPEATRWLWDNGLTTGVQAFACFMRFLFQPTTAIVDRVRPYWDAMRQPGVLSVGIHIRTGDKSFWSDGGDGEDLTGRHIHLFNCAEATVEREFTQEERMEAQVEEEEGGEEGGSRRYSSTLWYVATDSERLKAQLKEKFGDKILVTDIQPRHIANHFKTYEELAETVNEAVGEWVLFAEIKFHIFRISGWSLTAALLTTDPTRPGDHIFPKGNNRLNIRLYQRFCNMEQPAEWKAFAQKWGHL